MWILRIICFFKGHERSGFIRHHCTRCFKDLSDEDYMEERKSRADAAFHGDIQSPPTPPGGVGGDIFVVDELKRSARELLDQGRRAAKCDQGAEHRPGGTSTRAAGVPETERVAMDPELEIGRSSQHLEHRMETPDNEART